MSASAPPAPKRGFPTSAKVLIALFAAVAVIAIAVAAFAGRGSQTSAKPPPQPVTPAPATSASVATETSPAASSAPPATVSNTNVANGCLGGSQDLDQAVLTAQKEAPITPVGAAEFTATLMRWANQAPATAGQGAIAPQVLSPTATQLARTTPSGAHALNGYAFSLNFSKGTYFVAGFAGNAATVAWTGQTSPTQNGVAQGLQNITGEVTLTVVNGAWRLQDNPGPSQTVQSELSASATAFAGGC